MCAGQNQATHNKRSNNNEKEFNQNYIGKEVEVLFEEPHIEAGKTYMKGHTTNYMVVKLETKENLENRIKNIEIIGMDGLELIGDIVCF